MAKKKIKFNKQFGNKKPRTENKTERGRLGTMVEKDKKKEANKRKCRGKVNTDD